VPRVGVFALPPTATLAEAEIVVKQRWKLEDLELEFALFDLDTDEMTFISKETEIGSIDHAVNSLTVRPAQIVSAIPDVRSAALESCGVCRGEAEVPEEALLQSIQITVRTVNRDLPAYRFVCDLDKSEFEMRFPAGAKVADARLAIAHRFARASDEVLLFFMGKALKDGFVMDRLRLGESQITVYLPSLDAIILATAPGLRC
jgi:hypothetical protein